MATETKNSVPPSTPASTTDEKTAKDLLQITKLLAEILTSENSFMEVLTRLNKALGPQNLTKLPEPTGRQLSKLTAPYKKLLTHHNTPQQQPSKLLLTLIPSTTDKGTEAKGTDSTTVTPLTAAQAKEAIENILTWLENRRFDQLLTGALLYTEATACIPEIVAEQKRLDQVKAVLGEKDTLQSLLPAIIQRPPRYPLLLVGVNHYLQTILPPEGLTDDQLSPTQRTDRQFAAQQHLRIEEIERRVVEIDFVYGLQQMDLPSPKKIKYSSPEFIFSCLKASLSYLTEDLIGQQVGELGAAVTKKKASSTIDDKLEAQKKHAALTTFFKKLKTFNNLLQITDAISSLKEHPSLGSLHPRFSAHLEKLLRCIKKSIPSLDLSELASSTSIATSATTNIAEDPFFLEETEKPEMVEEQTVREEFLNFLLRKIDPLFITDLSKLVATDFAPSVEQTFKKFPQAVNLNRTSLQTLIHDATRSLKRRIPDHYQIICEHLLTLLKSHIKSHKRAGSAPAGLSSFFAPTAGSAAGGEKTDNAPPLSAAPGRVRFHKRVASTPAALPSFLAPIAGPASESETKGVGSGPIAPRVLKLPPKPSAGAAQQSANSVKPGLASDIPAKAPVSTPGASGLPPLSRTPSGGANVKKLSELFASKPPDSKSGPQPKRPSARPASAPAGASSAGSAASAATPMRLDKT